MIDFAQAIGTESLDFRGGALVEAGAGTGKTYNIQHVYLRLVIAEGLRVQNILAVTFTEAATQELRDRLRRILSACEAVLAGAGGTEAEAAIRERLAPLLRLPLAGLPPGADRRREQLRRTRRALMDFDSAAIFTIHGFCNRVLERYAFECGHDPEAELIAETGELIADLCRDWWRRHAYEAGPAALVPFEDLGELTRLTREAAGRPDALLLPRMDAKEAAEALRAFARVLAAALGTRPRMEATNECSRRLEAVLREMAAGCRPGGTGNLLLLRRAAGIIVCSTDPFRWTAPPPAGGRTKIGLDVRLPGAAETAPAALKAARSRMAAVADELRGGLRHGLRDRGAITYDAMLLRVRDALRDPSAGRRLAAVLRAEFQAALVDEFQDTDPVQYESFRRLFAEGLLPLLLVGDPKQAIYGFRGGDIFTYHDARGRIAECRRFALGRNFRSETALVEAVNELFADRPGRPAFATSRIVHVPTTAAGVDDSRRLTAGDPPAADPRPLKLWRYQAGGGKPPAVQAAADRICNDVADEIARLLNDVRTRIGGRPLRPSDIAILVCTHDEAARFRQALGARGVNAVRQARDNVFNTPEAHGLLLVMQALLTPGDLRAIRSALCSGLLPCDAEQVRRFRLLAEADGGDAPAGAADRGAPASPEEWLDCFRAAGACWRRRSFVEAFRLLAGRTGFLAHIARHAAEAPDERLAALQQLVELAHQAAMRGRLAPEALLRWFARQCDPGTRAEDESFRNRPAGDDDAVRIMTVFKAKGLEFPVVFAPALWRRQAGGGRGGGWLAYHREDQESRRFEQILDLGDEQKEIARQERLEEDLRLIYVAVTRAVNRVYLVAAERASPVRPEETCALARLLAGWDAERAARSGAASRIEVQARPFAAGPAEGAAPSPVVWRRPPPPGIAAPYAGGAAVVDKRHGRTSFTALVARGAPDEMSADADEARDIDAAEASRPPRAPAAEAIFRIPGGARTGDCWHALFESLDFQADPAARARVVDETLDRYNLCAPAGPEGARRRAAVHEMVARVLAAPLPTPDGPVSLAGIPLRARRSELRFDFPLQRRERGRTLGALAAVLDRHWRTPARDDAFLAALARAERRLPQGFMSGAIDLLFEHGGRFYIVDWKSNLLEGRRESFVSRGLARAMAAHSYYLQYIIYAVAAEGFLRQVLEGYDHERHFGGVFYLFLRGVSEAGDAGIFHDRPSAACIEAVARFLAGDGT